VCGGGKGGKGGSGAERGGPLAGVEEADEVLRVDRVEQLDDHVARRRDLAVVVVVQPDEDLMINDSSAMPSTMINDSSAMMNIIINTAQQ
jgi:hypothetical protein